MAKLGKHGIAILIMAAIIAVLLMLCTPRSTSKSSAPSASRDTGSTRNRDPTVVRVLALVYDPTVPDSGGRPAHSAFGWNDPRALATEYARDALDASERHLRYEVVEWRVLDEFPRKHAGFQYTAQTYAACLAQRHTCHQPDEMDYASMLWRQNVVRLIDTREIDEVWLFGGPYFGFYEAAMAGPGAFDINGRAFSDLTSTRAFAVMGFNYERGVAEMLHDLCHRVEGTMTHVYGGWAAESSTTSWARFAANAAQSGGKAGVGSCHYPPNATSDYDYDNRRSVDSDADDWLAYPALTGRRRRINRDTWGGPDYHRGYMRWWLRHLPRAGGVAPDGKLANWWSYVVSFDSLVIAPNRQ